jgi:hypothetical protein
LSGLTIIMVAVTDFALGAAPLGSPVPPVRRLLSRLVGRSAPALPTATVDPIPTPAAVPPVVPVPSETPAVTSPTVVPDGAGAEAIATDVRTTDDLTCSWPAFVKGSDLESLRWMDTPDGPVLIGRFSPPVPRHLAR